MKVIKLIAMTWIVCCLSGVVLAKQKKHTKARAHTRTTTRVRAVAPAIYGADQLNNEINRLIAESNAKANVAVYVKSMKYNDNLFTRNVNQLLTPASTMKILTAEAGLIYLGSNYKFSTQLFTDAKSIQNGTLKGNLYIVLGGDPTLTYPDLMELMSSLQDLHVQSIAGNVYIDNSAYDQRFYGPGWVWSDKSYCYAAPISASIINHNCMSFSSKPTKASSSGSSASRSLLPPLRDIKEHYVSGFSYVVTDVPEYNRALFKNVLQRMSIYVYGNITFGSAGDNLSLISSHESKPLPMLITEMLKKSDNIIAGALFKKIGQQYTHQQGSWENGSLAVSQILARRASVNTSGMRILDGSGLSPDNLASPAQMMQVLDYAFHHDPIGDHFIAALPISGVDGTLKHRMLNIIRRVRAKTGTISGVVSLAGYVTSANQEPLAFVIMINGSRGMGWRYKALEDKIVTALSRYSRRDS